MDPVRKRATRPAICIITPTLRDSNSGNWHTAARWARFLRPLCRVQVLQQWHGEPCDALIALHARRSAASITAFHAAHPQRGLALVLTGTDLYRDIHRNRVAQRSLQLATELVVLQERGPAALPARLQRKVRVIFQSAPHLAAVNRPSTPVRRRSRRPPPPCEGPAARDACCACSQTGNARARAARGCGARAALCGRCTPHRNGDTALRVARRTDAHRAPAR